MFGWVVWNLKQEYSSDIIRWTLSMLTTENMYGITIMLKKNEISFILYIKPRAEGIKKLRKVKFSKNQIIPDAIAEGIIWF